MSKTGVETDVAALPAASSEPRRARALAREYYELTKPRVVALIVFTAIVGMFLSSPHARHRAGRGVGGGN